MKLNTQRTTALRLENGLLHVDAFEWRGPESTVVASGSVGLAEGVDGSSAAGRRPLAGAAARS